MKCEYQELWHLPDDEQVDLCQRLFEGPYKECFPNLDEAENPGIWLGRRPGRSSAGSPEVYIIAVIKSGEALGGIIFERYIKTNAWLITYLFVSESCRGMKVSRELVKRARQTVEKQSAGRGFRIYSEAENPEYFSNYVTGPGSIADQKTAYKRLEIMAKFGMRRVDFDYIQPALEPEKHALDKGELLLLTWVDDQDELENNKDLGDAVYAFLEEFYESFEKSGENAAYLQKMRLSITDSVNDKASEHKNRGEKNPKTLFRKITRIPADLDDFLGKAESITVRITFFSSHLSDIRTKVLIPDREGAPSKDIHGEIPLYLVFSNKDVGLETTESHFFDLTNEYHSFHKDIVVSNVSAGERPLIIRAEKAANGTDVPAVTKRMLPRKVRVFFPNTFEMNWEGEDEEYPLTSSDDGFYVDAYFVDSIAVFESGYIAYSMALVFRSESLVELNATAILALTSVTVTAGSVTGDGIKLAYLETGAKENLGEFLSQRVKYIFGKEEQHIRKAFQAFTKNNCEIVQEGEKSLSEQIKEKFRRLDFSWRRGAEEASRNEGNGLVQTTASASIEVIGAEFHEEIEAVTKKAKTRGAPVNDFTLRLAGLAQNVLDFQDQDASEIYDSLGEGDIFGSDITYCHKHLSIRFSKSSRSYEDMWPVLGGEPYLYLVELVTAHNQVLIQDLNSDIRKHQSLIGLSGRANSRHKDEKYLGKTASEREEFFHKVREETEENNLRRIRLAHYIPNIFRYPIEKRLYQLITESRSFEAQLESFRKFDLTIERLVKDESVVDRLFEEWQQVRIDERKEKDEKLKSGILFFIGFVQTVGVFAGFACVFATLTALRAADLEDFVERLKRVLAQPVIPNLVHEISIGQPKPYELLPVWFLVPTFEVLAMGFFLGITGLLAILPGKAGLFLSSAAALLLFGATGVFYFVSHLDGLTECALLISIISSIPPFLKGYDAYNSCTRRQRHGTKR